MSLCITQLHAGGLIVNYRCSSACRHCLYACGPHRAGDYMSQPDACAALSRIRELGCRSVHIGGGEPLLEPERLRLVLRAARDAGVTVGYVETNSSWHTDASRTRDVLGMLHAEGLGTLLISISPFHNEHIPFGKVRAVLDACHAAGLSAFPWIVDFAAEIRAFDTTVPHTLDEYTQRFGDDYVPNLMHRYGITLGGRALRTFEPCLDHLPAEDILWRDANACDRLENTYHFHVDLYGNYIPGLCAGLAIRLDDLGRPLDPAAYPVLSRLHEGGVGGLFRWAMDEHAFRPSPEGYVNACHLCQSIRGHLVSCRGVDSPELQPAGFYESL